MKKFGHPLFGSFAPSHLYKIWPAFISAGRPSRFAMIAMKLIWYYFQIVAAEIWTTVRQFLHKKMRGAAHPSLLWTGWCQFHFSTRTAI